MQSYFAAVICWGAVLGVFLCNSVQAAAPTGTSAAAKCEAARNAAAGEYFACMQTAESNYVTSGDAAKYRDQQLQCLRKYEQDWTKAEQQAGGACPSGSDSIAVQDFLDACTQSIAVSLDGSPLPLDVVTCNSELTDTAQELDVCSDDLSVCDTGLGACTEDLEAAESSATSCAVSLASCGASLGTCTGDLATCDSELAASQSAGTTCNTELTVSQGQTSVCLGALTVCEDDVSTCAGELSQCDDQTEECEQDLVDCDAASDATAADLAQCANELSATVVALAQCSGDLADEEAVSAACTGELETTQDELSVCQDDLGNCRSQAGALIPQTGQIACYNASALLPSCAGTGQDGELRRGAARNFLDNGDGTISDDATGLMWEKLSDDGSIHDKDTGYTWLNAFSKIAALNVAAYAGYTDWRLPNILELETLRNVGSFSPATFSAFHSGCVAGCTVTTCSCTRTSFWYWSSSTYQGLITNAWNVSFSQGTSDIVSKSGTGNVRAVRG
ncbi:MAG TPA: DUF1566 domain-containing protein [Candidatus Binatia bacterium]|nr:DUF1566 domain-containing protein [Candidatus Binatia bacterium]